MKTELPQITSYISNSAMRKGIIANAIITTDLKAHALGLVKRIIKLKNIDLNPKALKLDHVVVGNYSRASTVHVWVYNENEPYPCCFEFKASIFIMNSAMIDYTFVRYVPPVKELPHE